MTNSFKRPWPASALGGLTIREAIERTWAVFNDQAILTRAAAISFYGAAAVVPFLGLVIVLLANSRPWINRVFAGDMRIEPGVDPVEWLLPSQAATLIEAELNRIRAEPRPGLLSFGVAVLLWLSSSVFVEVIDALHSIRGCGDIRPFWQRRLVAIVMTLVSAAILITAMVTVVVWPQILGWLGLSMAASILATIVHFAVVILTVYATFTLAIRVGSNCQRGERWFTAGNMFGALVVLGASVLLRTYAQNWADYGATYGSLASIMLLMSWLWLVSLALLVAAAINKVVDDASRETRERPGPGGMNSSDSRRRGLPEGRGSAASVREKGDHSGGWDRDTLMSARHDGTDF